MAAQARLAEHRVRQVAEAQVVRAESAALGLIAAAADQPLVVVAVAVLVVVQTVQVEPLALLASAALD
jgi:hypothetical protein